MPRTGGWHRVGSRRRFRYVDARGRTVTGEAKLDRIQQLAIPPAWRDVWISPRASAKLQATGVDAAGRVQYLYHPEFVAAREQEKWERLIGFGERLPSLRASLAEHLTLEPAERERVCATATRLLHTCWFRVGSDRHTRRSRTFGVTTLTKRHVEVRGKRVRFSFPAKHGIPVRTTVVDDELAAAIRTQLELPGGSRLFRYSGPDGLQPLTAAVLNGYLRTYLGDEHTAKDFRTWGGTLRAALVLAEHGPAETETEARRVLAAAMRSAGEALGNTATIARTAYVSPAVVEQYRDGRTLDRFRPDGRRNGGLTRDERALLGLLRSWRIRRRRGDAGS